MARRVDLLLPVKRQVVAIFAHYDLRQQSRRGHAAFLQAFRQRGDDRDRVHFPPMHIFAPDDPAAKELRRLVIKLLFDFRPDAPPVRRSRLHLRWFNNFLDHRQIRRPARLILPRAPRWGLAGWEDRLQLRGGLVFF